MTTIAFDGEYIAADTLACDPWGLISYTRDKIKIGKDFYIAFSGTVHQIQAYWKTIFLMDTEEIINHGYPGYDKEDGIQGFLCCIDGRSWWLSGSCYMKNTRGIYAVGSGRDFALASMHLGKTAREAIIIASHFDNGTSNDAVVYRLKDHPAYIGK